MLKPTIQLFIKAFIIGVLINMSLQQVASAPLPPDEDTTLHHQQQPLKQKTPTSSDSLSNQQEDW
jgi:hypothetical protein